jgi:O-acetyl-ADP-ribose deacetylase (regulator of RNase III)
LKKCEPGEGIAYAIKRATPESLEALREVLRRRCEQTRKLWEESGGELFGVRVVVDDCLPQGEARLVSTTDEVRLVNIGGADAGE